MSTEAISYCCILMGMKSVTGVRNVAAGMSCTNLSALKERAEDELLRIGAGEMDFDGKFSLNSEVDSIFSIVREPNVTLFLDTKRNGIQRHHTYSIKDNEAVYIKENGIAKYQFILEPKEKVNQTILDFLDMPSAESLPTTTVIESKLLKEADVQTLSESGCDMKTAKIINNSLNGNGLFCLLQSITATGNTDKLIFIAADDGILGVGLDYSNGREDIVFRSTNKSDIENTLRKMIQGGE